MRLGKDYNGLEGLENLEGLESSIHDIDASANLNPLSFLNLLNLNYFAPGGQFFLKNVLYNVDKCCLVPAPSEILCVRLG